MDLYIGPCRKESFTLTSSLELLYLHHVFISTYKKYIERHSKSRISPLPQRKLDNKFANHVKYWGQIKLATHRPDDGRPARGHPSIYVFKLDRNKYRHIISKQFKFNVYINLDGRTTSQDTELREIEIVLKNMAGRKRKQKKIIENYKRNTGHEFRSTVHMEKLHFDFK